MTCTSGQKRFSVKYVRSKADTISTDECLIIRDAEVRTLQEYIATFLPEHRVGRFFRKINTTKNGDLYAVNCPIGKNTLAGYPQLIAKFIGCSNDDARLVYNLLL